MATTPVFLPGESHGQRSLAGYSPWSRKESDRTEVTWHGTSQSIQSFSHVQLLVTPWTVAHQGIVLSWRIPVDRGAWQATVHGVAKSRTRLKQLSTQEIS